MERHEVGSEEWGVASGEWRVESRRVRIIAMVLRTTQRRSYRCAEHSLTEPIDGHGKLLPPSSLSSPSTEKGKEQKTTILLQPSYVDTYIHRINRTRYVLVLHTHLSVVQIRLTMHAGGCYTSVI